MSEAPNDVVPPVTIEIITGDCREIIPALPAESVDCVVTSPPYFWLRDYEVEGQIGHEDTVDAFVDTIAGVFDAVRPVLKSTGVVWLNLGDTYFSGNGSLCGVPWRVALEMQRRGWTLRSDVVWCRPTALAEPSVKDRPGRQHEYLFLFSKSRRYWFDRTALNEESVWHIAHQRGLGIHSTAFPEGLAEQCILSGCPEGGTVLDPFGGSGTTGLVAERLGRNATLVELNPSFAEDARRRVAGAPPARRPGAPR